VGTQPNIKEKIMGYRSDVAMLFYTRDTTKVAVLKLWLHENLPFGDWPEEDFKEVEDGYKFSVTHVKWYEGYEEVARFNEVIEKYKDLFCNEERCAFEFVRLGEGLEDVEEDYAGVTDDRIYVTRTIAFN
jgi:hypothetical protein